MSVTTATLVYKVRKNHNHHQVLKRSDSDLGNSSMVMIHFAAVVRDIIDTGHVMIHTDIARQLVMFESHGCPL